MRPLELIECPRDAIQGWPYPISTADKIAYYRALLQVGFTCLDLGSFVSHKAVPQMADTLAVCNALYDEGLLNGATQALVIVANERGAREARTTPGLNFVGFPMSLSETFQLRNTGADLDAAWVRLKNIREIISDTNLKLVVYLSMGFGNPYGDVWSPALVSDWIGRLTDEITPEVISLSDTIGHADPSGLSRVFSEAFETFPLQNIGAHLHAAPWEVADKINAAWDAGCRRFDTAMRGIGGCPMAQKQLVGNVPTEMLIETLKGRADFQLNERAWNQSMSLAVDLFSADAAQ